MANNRFSRLTIPTAVQNSWKCDTNGLYMLIPMSVLSMVPSVKNPCSTNGIICEGQFHLKKESHIGHRYGKIDGHTKIYHPFISFQEVH